MSLSLFSVYRTFACLSQDLQNASPSRKKGYLRLLYPCIFILTSLPLENLNLNSSEFLAYGQCGWIFVCGGVSIDKGGLFVGSTLLAHAGDGNFHAIILFDPTNKEEVKEALELSNGMVHDSLSMEGSLPFPLQFSILILF